MIERLRRLLWPKKIRYPRLCRPKYVGRHPGRVFLILGAGPSLLRYRQAIRQFVEAREPILLSANAAGMEFGPQYVSFINRRRLCERAHLVGHRTALIGPHIPAWIVRRVGLTRWERMPWRDHLGPFGIHQGVIQSDCGMSAGLLLAVAAVMGASEVWTAGVDGYAVGSPTSAFSLRRPAHDLDRALECQDRMRAVLPEITQEYERRGIQGPWSLTPTRFAALVRGPSA